MEAGKEGKDASAVDSLTVLRVSTAPGSPSAGSSSSKAVDEKEPAHSEPAAAAPERIAQPAASYFRLYRCVFVRQVTDLMAYS